MLLHQCISMSSGWVVVTMAQALRNKLLEHINRQSTWISRDWLNNWWLSNLAPHVKPICSFASLHFFADFKGIVFCIVKLAVRVEINLETKGRSKPHEGAHLLQTQEMERKEGISVSRRQTRDFGDRMLKWWVLRTIYSVCVTSFLSLNINKLFVCF